MFIRVHLIRVYILCMCACVWLVASHFLEKNCPSLSTNVDVDREKGSGVETTGSRHNWSSIWRCWFMLGFVRCSMWQSTRLKGHPFWGDPTPWIATGDHTTGDCPEMWWRRAPKGPRASINGRQQQVIKMAALDVFVFRMIWVRAYFVPIVWDHIY